ncbi:uncharacterized protein B0P05DRAFT_531167 [Gilbertella persicaria]|uniref:uncharacterized protein n=1 Tax=Gilbertella persicaria TaxID=101096 RepID=UPI00221F3B5A|nr:uncharacterized protein B0P05DRAFT_531167 [Gilbertella persicaria]KAI8088026.1 hypothetical protein B0P05DRAFT_531167 [Gilbertella persicaria]
MTASILSSNLHRFQQDTPLHQFIQTNTVGDVLNKVKPTYRGLLDLPLTSTMEEAFDLLLAGDILSVPIYNLNGQGEKQYVAIVSALDLLKLLSTKVSLDTLQTNSDALLMPLHNAISITEPLRILKSSDNLSELLSLFSSAKTHRVLIQHEGIHVLLSQMDLIHFFQASNHQLGSTILDLPISEIKSNGVKLHINYKCTAAEAFLKLAADDHISALPVIDDNGDLITDISAQDVRGLNRNRWESLMKPVVMYLKSSHGDLIPPFTCHDRFTLSQVMSAFVIRKAHRLWWMDYQTGELKGVITLTDILSTFASH